MIYLLLVMFILAGVHFIYESTIAPTWRLGIRYKLFTLRDRLREMKINSVEGLNDDLFNNLDTAINGTISNLSSVNLNILFQAKKEFENNPQVQKVINEKIALVNASGNEEIIEIHREISRNMFFALLCNSMMLHVYLLPFYIFILVLITLFHKMADLRNHLKISFQRLLVAPQNKINQDHHLYNNDLAY